MEWQTVTSIIVTHLVLGSINKLWIFVTLYKKVKQKLSGLIGMLPRDVIGMVQTENSTG